MEKGVPTWTPGLGARQPFPGPPPPTPEFADMELGHTHTCIHPSPSYPLQPGIQQGKGYPYWDEALE